MFLVIVDILMDHSVSLFGLSFFVYSHHSHTIMQRRSTFTDLAYVYLCFQTGPYLKNLGRKEVCQDENDCEIRQTLA